ncbi:hypothetical protein CF319_g7263 [Tilletia indica]|nr:hypothetical protein CF319_g7263 [Tilletia indica]
MTDILSTEPDYAQVTDDTMGPSLSQRSPSRTGEGGNQDATLDRMERLLESVSDRMARQSQEQMAAMTQLFQEQMGAMQRQHEERIQLILAQDQTRASDASSPTARAASRMNQSRQSAAARVFLGAEDQTARETLPTTQSQHSGVRSNILNPLVTPAAPNFHSGPPGTAEDLRPRRFTPAKPSDIGLYEPEKGRDIFSWWRGVVQYQAYSGATDAEIFSGLPGCFTKWPRQWLDELVPRPPTLKDFRNRAFQAFMRDTTLIQQDVDRRQFKPDEESLENYLSDKYRLVSELQVSKAITAGHTDFDNPTPEAAHILMTVKDAIQTVHNGLPAHWRPLMNLYRQEDDWPAYRSQLLANEQSTREAIAVFSGNVPLNKSQSNSWIKNNVPSSRTHLHAPIVSQIPATTYDNASRIKDREEKNCYHCHQPGHYKHECPKREDDIKAVRSVTTRSVKYTDYSDDDVVRVVPVRSRKVRISTDDEDDISPALSPLHWNPPANSTDYSDSESGSDDEM